MLILHNGGHMAVKNFVIFANCVLSIALCLFCIKPLKCVVKFGDVLVTNTYPDCKVDDANMGPIWGRQDPGGSHVDSLNFAIWVIYHFIPSNLVSIHLSDI